MLVNARSNHPPEHGVCEDSNSISRAFLNFPNCVCRSATSKWSFLLTPLTGIKPGRSAISRLISPPPMADFSSSVKQTLSLPSLLGAGTDWTKDAFARCLDAASIVASSVSMAYASRRATVRRSCRSRSDITCLKAPRLLSCKDVAHEGF